MPLTLEQRRTQFSEKLEAYLERPADEELRDYQLDAVGATHQYIGEQGQSHGYINIPTGGGKTRIFLTMLDALYREPSETPPKTYVVVPTRRLLKQTYDTLSEHYPHIQAGVYYSERKELENPVTVITYDSFADLVANGTITPQETDYLILDEAHRGLSGYRQGIIQRFQDTSVMLGFTASPEFDEVRGVYRLLGDEIYGISHEQLWHKGWLSPHKNPVVEVQVPQARVNALGEKQARREAMTEAAIDLLLHYRDARENGEQILGQSGLIYCEDIAHAEYVAERFNNDPRVRKALQDAVGRDDIVPVTVVHGGMSETELNRHFEDFKNGKTLVLASARLTIEGIDMVNAAWAINSETWSQVDALQRGGRLSRLDPDNPNKLSRSFDLYFPERNKRKPYFYTDVVGGVQFGRRGEILRVREDETRRAPRRKPPYESGIRVHDTPEELYHLERRLEDQGRKIGRYLGIGGMADQLDAWPKEVDWLYGALTEAYQKTADRDLYVEALGLRIPREYFRLIQDNGSSSLVLDERAAPMLARLLFLTPEKDEAFILLDDVVENLNRATENSTIQEITEQTRTFFREAENAFAAVVLPKKYASAIGGTQPVTNGHLQVGRLTIPLEHVEVFRTPEGVKLGIHENSLSELWHQRPTDKTDEWKYKREFVRSMGVWEEDQEFLSLWADAEHQFKRNPFAPVLLDGRPIQCGIRFSANHTKPFCLHESETEYFKDKLRVRPAGWISPSQISERYFGDVPLVVRKIEKYRENLVKQEEQRLTEQQPTLDDQRRHELAERNVSTQYAGYFRRQPGHSRGFFINPDLMTTLEQEGLFRTRDISEKQEGDLNYQEMTAILHTSNPYVVPLYEALEEACRKQNDLSDTVRITNVPVEEKVVSLELPKALCGLRRSGNMPYFSIRKEAVPMLEAALSFAPHRGGEDLDFNRMAREISAETLTVRAIYKALQDAYDASTEEQSLISVENIQTPQGIVNIEIPRNLLGYRRAGQTFFTVKREGRSFFENALDRMPLKTEDELSCGEMQSLLHVGYKRLGPVYKALEAAYNDEANKEKEAIRVEVSIPDSQQPIVVEIPKALMGIRRQNHGISFLTCHKSTSDIFAKALYPVPQKTSDNLTVTEMARLIAANDVNVSSVYKALEQAYLDPANADNDTLRITNVALERNKRASMELPKASVGYRRSGVQEPFTVDQSAQGVFEEAILSPKKNADDLTRDEMFRAVGGRRKQVVALYQALETAYYDPAEPQKDVLSVAVPFEGKTLQIAVPREIIGPRRIPGNKNVFCCNSELMESFREAIFPERTTGGLWTQRTRETSIKPDNIDLGKEERGLG